MPGPLDPTGPTRVRHGAKTSTSAFLRVRYGSKFYRRKSWVFKGNVGKWLICMAGTTGLEPATSDVTGRKSQRLSGCMFLDSGDLRTARWHIFGVLQ